MKKLQVNDTVIVIAGKEKGKKGRVLRIIGEKVYVEGGNMVLRNIKKGLLGAGKAGTQVRVEGPVHISNVMLVCPQCSEPTKIRIELIDGKKSRVCKKCGKPIVKSIVTAQRTKKDVTDTDTSIKVKDKKEAKI